jgi:hypothetical protein
MSIQQILLGSDPYMPMSSYYISDVTNTSNSTISYPYYNQTERVWFNVSGGVGPYYVTVYSWDQEYGGWSWAGAGSFGSTSSIGMSSYVQLATPIYQGGLYLNIADGRGYSVNTSQYSVGSIYNVMGTLSMYTSSYVTYLSPGQYRTTAGQTSTLNLQNYHWFDPYGGTYNWWYAMNGARPFTNWNYLAGQVPNPTTGIYSSPSVFELYCDFTNSYGTTTSNIVTATCP